MGDVRDIHDIRYEAPRSIDEAVILLASADPEDVRVLAGGTDLLVQMASGLRTPATVVNVKRIPELCELRFDDDGTLWLGAAACAAAIGENARVREAFPGLAEATALIGSDQIQGRASIGGNLCNASPAADTVPSLVVLRARCHVAGPEGRRVVPAARFVTGPGRNVLRQGELLIALEIPPAPARSADAYLRLIPRTEMDIAVAGAAVWLALDPSGETCSDARVALGAVGPTVLEAEAAAQALRGHPIDDTSLAAAAAAASTACQPIDDKRGPAEYRRRMAGVLTQRAARRAFERARQACERTA